MAPWDHWSQKIQSSSMPHFPSLSIANDIKSVTPTSGRLYFPNMDAPYNMCFSSSLRDGVFVTSLDPSRPLFLSWPIEYRRSNDVYLLSLSHKNATSLSWNAYSWNPTTMLWESPCSEEAHTAYGEIYMEKNQDPQPSAFSKLSVNNQNQLVNHVHKPSWNEGPSAPCWSSPDDAIWNTDKPWPNYRFMWKNKWLLFWVT